MIIQYCSDLHIEFEENKRFLDMNPLPVKGEILLLAGDIVPFSVIERHADFFAYIADNFEQTYWVPGNHEYYYSDAASTTGSFNEKIRSNISLVNNHVVHKGNTRFLFSTLWSKISPVNYWTVQQSVTDFHVIKFNEEKFTPEHFNQLHQNALEFLSDAFAQKHEGKTVVATHHVPTLMHYPEQYKHHPLNEAFSVELHDFILDANPDYWIYGHHHRNMPAFKIGKTTMLTNQLGYVRQGEQVRFDPGAVIED